MDTSRRGFFGTLAGALVAPKLVFTKKSKDNEVLTLAPQNSDPPICYEPRTNITIQYALVVEDSPFNVPFTFGKITAVEKDTLHPGKYRVFYKPPHMNMSMAPIVILNVHSGAPLIATINDLSPGFFFGVSIYDSTTGKPAPSDFSAVIAWQDIPSPLTDEQLAHLVDRGVQSRR
jgi:hypothetical protein